jgi:hypothetical protein
MANRRCGSSYSLLAVAGSPFSQLQQRDSQSAQDSGSFGYFFYYSF